MPRPLHPDPDPEQLARTRADAARRAQQLLTGDAPDDALERVAWAAGVGSVDGVRDEVTRARAAGYTWAQIGAALGQNAETVRIKYSATGYAAQRRYRERRRADEV